LASVKDKKTVDPYEYMPRDADYGNSIATARSMMRARPDPGT
jgi:hypothetical protein